MSDEAITATEPTSLQAVIAEVRAELARLEPARAEAMIAFDAIDMPVQEARILIIKGDEHLLRTHLAKLKAIQ